MKRFSFLCLVVGGSMTFSVFQSRAIAPSDPQTHAQVSKATLEGLVRDIACPIQNPDATATHLSMKCLVACARKGSPLVILTKDGELYLPISGVMPDIDQRQKLVPYLGKYVRVTGTGLREERNACDRDP
jgi:hypothetical protein